jgi:hypothetical protein
MDKAGPTAQGGLKNIDCAALCANVIDIGIHA